MKAAFLLSSLALLVSPLRAGQEADLALPLESEPAAIDFSALFNASEVRSTYTSGMDFDRIPGDVDLFQASLQTFLAEPASLGGDITLLAYLNYTTTRIDINAFPFGPAPATPRYDWLQRVSLSTLFVRHPSRSRWYQGLFLEPSFRSDLEEVSGHDFFLSAALVTAYQVNDDLIVGAGLYGSELNHDPFLVLGPGFMWTPTDDWLVSYYGPRFIARRTIGDNDSLGFELANHGSYWNVEGFNASNRLELRAWRAGLVYRHRIHGEWWLEAGAGCTLGGKLSLSTPDGLGLSENRLDTAPYAYLALTVKSW